MLGRRRFPVHSRQDALERGWQSALLIGTQTVLYASLEHVWVNEGGRPVAIPGVSIPDLSFTGWAVTTGGTFQF